ncbi:MAG: aminopeptidase P family protein [Chloroflexi bacterium]|nr:aminopeptidase P family protein [Chloroflexota bacterium]
MSAFQQRLERLRAELARAGVEALLVSQPESRFYLSGYTGHDLPPRDSAGYLLATRQRAYLLTDPRTSEQAAYEAPDHQVVVYGNVVSAPARMAELARQDGLKRVAFEAIHLPYLIARQVREALAPDAELVESTDLVDRLRIRKDPQELEQLRAAISVLDDCLAHVLQGLEPGRTEREIAWEVEYYLKTHGSAPSFDSIVASGPNASMPHAVPTDRRIQAHEPITIDIGARVGGYASDMTRTVCLGEAPEKLVEVYRVVQEAQEAAERAIRPGMTGREADALARQVIERAGYGQAFGHGTGHGIGLEVHEPPWLSPARGEAVLEPGMVFSVEPGIYLPGWGGVRIEDLVLLRADGVEVLPRSPKTLERAEVVR